MALPEDNPRDNTPVDQAEYEVWEKSQTPEPRKSRKVGVAAVDPKLRAEAEARKIVIDILKLKLLGERVEALELAAEETEIRYRALENSAAALEGVTELVQRVEALETHLRRENERGY